MFKHPPYRKLGIVSLGQKKRHWCGEVPKGMLLEITFPDSSIFIFQHCYVGPCCKIKDCFIWCGRKDFNFKDLKSKPGSTGATRHAEFLKGATSWYAPLKKFRPNFSSSSFVIRVNLLHPQPSLFLYGLLLFLWCFSILVSFYF